MVGYLNLYPYFMLYGTLTNWLELTVGLVIWSFLFTLAYVLLGNSKKKSPRVYNILKLSLIVIASVIVALLVFSKGNVSANYSGSYNDNGLDVDFVFTEPFASLADFESASIIKKVSAPDGTASTYLMPGRYGLYMIGDDGHKVLYQDLQIDNARNDIWMSEQGPWYVEVSLGTSDFNFRGFFPE